MSKPSTVGIKIDDDDVKAALRKARRDVNRNVRTGIKAAVDQTALPIARRRAPGFVRMNVSSGASRGMGYLTFRGRGSLRDAAGLHNFGGRRYDVIKPKKAKALKTPWGPRALVRMRGAKYEGKHFLEKGAEEGLDAFTTVVMGHVDRALDSMR